jgi:hypothetical protein
MWYFVSQGGMMQVGILEFGKLEILSCQCALAKVWLLELATGSLFSSETRGLLWYLLPCKSKRVDHGELLPRRCKSLKTICLEWKTEHILFLLWSGNFR